MRRLAITAALLLISCAKSPRIVLHYELPATLDPSTIVRVLTTVTVSSKDTRMFTADEPFRTVAQGVGYEVSVDDTTMERALVLTHDATLGYVFKSTFTFTLLPPVGGSPAFTISAKAYGASDTQVLAHVDAVTASFGSNGQATLAFVSDLCGTVTCGSDATCCNSTCIATDSDPSNCGGCGMACGKTGDGCAQGGCTCDTASPCTNGTQCCTGIGCIDTTSDTANCGGCGTACNVGETCVDSKCACGSAAGCPSGNVCCGGTCSSTGCLCNGKTCAAGTEICCDNTACAGTGDDDNNCGGCDIACAAPEKCKRSVCTCGTGASASTCKGDGDKCCSDGCHDIKTDPANCGDCGHTCAAGDSCVAGSCVCGSAAGASDCTDGKICCGPTAATSTCVSPSSGANCGSCGNACTTGSACVSATSGGKTTYMCQCPGTTQTCMGNQRCCSGVGCFDLSNDSANCLSCGHACGNGQSCSQGTCTGDVACSPTCGANFKCTGGQCLCGNTTCPAGDDCCNGACTNTQTDPMNCGTCNAGVSANQLCCAGKAVARDNNECLQCNTACALLTGCVKCSSGSYECSPFGAACN